MLAGCGSAGTRAESLAGGTLSRTTSGLLADHRFDRPLAVADLEHDFELNGSAPAANRVVSAAADGLHVGVTKHATATWEGFFAVTHASYPATSVFHVRMARSPAAVPRANESGEAVFAVQTGNTKQTGDINYVLVASLTTGGKTHWLVGYAEGHIADAKTTVLWQSAPAATGPLAEEITLVTDGASSLEVWFGSERVYASHSLHMRIAAPFQPYLEVQSLGIPYEAVFQRFWVTSGTAVTVDGLKAGDTVSLARGGGAAPVAATARDGGSAVLALPATAAHGTATVTVRRGGTALVDAPVVVAGGDVLRLNRR